MITRKKALLQPIIIGFAILLIIVSLGTYYMFSIKKILKEESYTYLKEIAEQSVRVIRNKMDGDFQTLKSISTFIGSYETLDLEYIFSILNHQNNKNDFKRLGIALPDGRAFTTDNSEMNLSDRDYFNLAMTGKENLSPPLTDKIGQGKINVYAVPIYNKDIVVGVLFATHNTEIYKHHLSINTFEGNGYSYISKNDGTIVVGSDHYNSIKNIVNIFDSLENEKLFKNELMSAKENMKLGGTGVFKYLWENNEYYMSYEPIGINDWYILSTIPKNIINKKSNYLINITLLVCFIIAILFALLFGYIITLQKIGKKALEKIAFTDDLTGGATWTKFKKDAEKILSNNDGLNYAIIAFDIDKFKVINELYGYKEGNRVLIYIAKLLSEMLGKNELFSRISSDDFTMFIKYDTTDDIVDKIKYINQKVNSIVKNYTIIFSFGIHRILDRKISIDKLSDRATIAKGTVKYNHEKYFAFYDDNIRNKIIAEKEIENNMESALANEEFQVYLQPKYFIKTSSIAGAEALIRWRHPQKGLISPSEFIPIFEKDGFIVKIDIFMLEKVCLLIKKWIDNGLQVTTISVNMSRVHLHTPDFPEILYKTTEKYNVPTKFIEIEITESAVTSFEDIKVLLVIMEQIKNYGFKISMDDFGTGYSSLNLLREMPFDILKLDQVFFGKSTDDERSKTLISDVVTMAKHLDMLIVAEGVETQKQTIFLNEIGCDIAQGYYFARPMPINNFEIMVFEK